MSDAHLLHFFGGKGGVGKSTLAAAHAFNLSEQVPKERVLIVSLEPVASLTDLLKKKLTAKPTKILAGKGEGGVFAAELDPAQLLAAFRKDYLSALQKAASKGQIFSEAEVTSLLSQSLPGLEELLALVEIFERLEDKSFDRIVIDGAPTSHLLRLFELPHQLKRLLALLKVSGAAIPVRPPKKDAPPPPPPKGFLEELVAKLDRINALLRDPARFAFHLVTLGEPVPEAQTRMLFNQLRERGIPVHEIIVNQVEDHEGCPACQGRRGLQAPHVRKYQALDKAVAVNLVGKREIAPRGAEAIKKFAKEWSTGKETKVLEFSAAEGPPALVRAPSMPPIAAPPLPPTRLIFFVGQGGVGKSSCAAAAAVTLTEKEGPVLLISTDSSHSLSDVLQSRLTDTETQVKGTKGLYARELDVAAWFNAFRRRMKEKAERAFDAASPRSADVPMDRELLRNLLECAPPAMDEFAGLAVLTDALVQERFKRIVVDPSPALTSVRIIDLAQIAVDWFTAVHALAYKYRVRGLGELAEELAGFIKHVKRFQAALATPTESRFVVVTRADELAAGRTERLVETLQGAKLQVERVLVNRVLPKSTCDKCENRRKNELNAAKAMEKKIGLPITVAPALGRHPAGLRELKAFRTAWYALSAPPAKIKAA